MGKTLLMCDSTCDLSLEQEKKYAIRVVNCSVEIDGLPYREREEINSAKIYEIVAKTGVLPHHSQITVIQFLEEYVRAARDGYTDVICVTMNAKGSGTYSAAMHAITLLSSEYPSLEGRIRIRVIDSTTYALGMGGPVAKAAEKLLKGACADDVVLWLEDYFAHQITLVGLFDLQYAKKSGRLNAVAAIVGDALGIKPIMSIMGENRVLATVRGGQNVIPKMVDLYIQFAADYKNDYFVAYGDSPELAKELVGAIKKRGGPSPYLVGPVGPCVAINTGPKMVGLGFYKK